MRSAANWWRSPGTVALATALVCLVVDGASPAAAAGARVSGAGSTTAYNQLDSWIYAIRPAGVTVDYDPQGATYGRANFRSGTTDFAVSELPYGIVDQGVTDPPPARPFAYLPVTAGAVAFPYNLVVNGRRVTDLRLSSAAVAGSSPGPSPGGTTPSSSPTTPAWPCPTCRSARPSGPTATPPASN